MDLCDHHPKLIDQKPEEAEWSWYDQDYRKDFSWLGSCVTESNNWYSTLINLNLTIHFLIAFNGPASSTDPALSSAKRASAAEPYQWFVGNGGMDPCMPLVRSTCKILLNSTLHASPLL